MAESLLAHLYTRIKGSQEDVATLSLQYILSNAKALNDGFNRIVSQKLQVEYDDTIKYVCQATGDNKERPDMAGYDRDNKEIILCEMKFYAGLTDNQPLGYIDRLKDANGQGLIFICPKVRITSLWTKVKERCKSDGRGIEELSNHCIKVDGINMSIVSWGDILDVLYEIACESARESKSDLEQLRGYCNQLDSDAFIPFTDDDFSPEMAKKAMQYYQVVDGND